MDHRPTLKPFRYLEELDAFLPTPEYLEVAQTLGLTEWNAVVWMGRLFTLDNDYGEHWFDNWDLREQKQEASERLALDPFDLLIVDPDRFQDGKDGPCNPPELRRRFWTEVLRSLELSYDLLFDKARHMNEWLRETYPPDVLEHVGHVPDLEERIARLKEAREPAQPRESARP